MTPEQIELHRKRFEEVFAAKGTGQNFDVCELGRYRSSFVWHCWQGYLMAIESIEIDIPDDDCFEYSESGITILDSGIRRGTMINSIQSLGLKVKEQK